MTTHWLVLALQAPRYDVTERDIRSFRLRCLGGVCSLSPREVPNEGKVPGPERHPFCTDD
jgi:hypothetical protein